MYEPVAGSAQHAWRSQRGGAPKTPSGVKTGVLPRGAAVVVGARHPSQARVVSAELGERRRAGNRIRHVVVAALGVRDGVPANRARATLKPNYLALKATITRQDDAAIASA